MPHVKEKGAGAGPAVTDMARYAGNFLSLASVLGGNVQEGLK